jgi:hypothetical protein
MFTFLQEYALIVKKDLFHLIQFKIEFLICNNISSLIMVLIGGKTISKKNIWEKIFKIGLIILWIILFFTISIFLYIITFVGDEGEPLDFNLYNFVFHYIPLNFLATLIMTSFLVTIWLIFRSRHFRSKSLKKKPVKSGEQ